MMAMWFGEESDVSGNAFITLPKLFSGVVPSPRCLFWRTVEHCARVLPYFIPGMDVRRLLGSNISSALQNTLSSAETIVPPIDIYDF